jgi:branched-chain amino acid aminotransferase
MRRVSKNVTRCLAATPTFNSKNFKASDMIYNVDKDPKPLPDNFHSKEFLQELPFGSMPTPHMLHIDWTAENGWGKPRIEPFGPMVIPAASGSLHYGMQVFEGMKAYYQKDKDQVVMFRPDMNAKRFVNSSRAVALPTEIDTDELVECIRKLVEVDRAWVPEHESGSLYIRPTHIATNANLGVAPPDSSKIFVMLTPVGPYFKTGLQPVSLLADPKLVRAWPGGTGQAKCGGNYGPTIPIQKLAMEETGCSQVLWLFNDGHEQGPLITEVGTMNFMCIWKRESDGKLELITPPLDEPEGSHERDFILPGVTRDSLLSMARSWNEFEVTEKSIRWGEFKKALDEGRVVEAFGAGTACVVQPIGKFFDKTTNPEGEWVEIPEGDVYRKRFYDALVGIQLYGHEPPHQNWVVKV